MNMGKPRILILQRLTKYSKHIKIAHGTSQRHNQKSWNRQVKKVELYFS